VRVLLCLRPPPIPRQISYHFPYRGRQQMYDSSSSHHMHTFGIVFNRIKAYHLHKVMPHIEAQETYHEGRQLFLSFPRL